MTKLVLRIAFLVVLAWLLAKFVAVSPGGITIGKVRRHRNCGDGSFDWRSMRAGAGNTYVATGMGAEMIATPGTAVAPVGRPLTLF